ncbi:hypothetical protein [Streptomyces sp. SD15]
MQGEPIAGRRSRIYTLWLFIPASGMAAVWLALYRAAVHNGSNIAACEGAYHVTPGWFFFLTPEDRGQWPRHAVEPR